MGKPRPPENGVVCLTEHQTSAVEQNRHTQDSRDQAHIRQSAAERVLRHTSRPPLRPLYHLHIELQLTYYTVEYDPFIESQLASCYQLQGIMCYEFGHVTFKI